MNSRSQECVQELRYLSKEEAVAIETELLRDYGFRQQQLTEMLGHAYATAIAKVFPLASLQKGQPMVLVACGPDQNGLLGQEYILTVFIPKRSSDGLHQDLTLQCERMDLPFLSYLPTEVSQPSPGP